MVKGARLWGVVALCVLSGNGWILKQGWPSEMQWPYGACLHFGLIGMLGLAVASLQGAWNGLRWLHTFWVGVAGICLFALPAASLQFAGGKISGFSSVAVFCAVPLMTVVAEGAFGSGAEETTRLQVLMAPSVAGLGGALLLFPLANPGSVSRWLFLGLMLGCCVVVALAGVWMHRLLQGTGVAAAVAITGLASAALLGSYGAVLGWPVLGLRAVGGEMLRCAVFDLPLVWLTVWLMREVTPARLSARFLLVPLVAVVEGYAVEREPLDLKTLVAVSLLCAGGVLLLFRDQPEELPALRLR